LHIFKELESESDELYPKVNRKIMLETNSGNPLYLAVFNDTLMNSID
jgi:hypothetical protein